jgi:hypothetical protein
VKPTIDCAGMPDLIFNSQFIQPKSLELDANIFSTMVPINVPRCIPLVWEVIWNFLSYER